MNHTIFDNIVSGNMKSWKVWEDEKFLAFLTPFPNTPGFTVVIPKQNPGDYVFSLDDELYTEMMLAVKKVGLRRGRAEFRRGAGRRVRPARGGLCRRGGGHPEPVGLLRGRGAGDPPDRETVGSQDGGGEPGP